MNDHPNSVSNSISSVKSNQELVAKRPKKPSKCCMCCKTFLRILFSHFGLLILVIIYIVGGAYLFQTLEKHASIQKCQLGEGEDRKNVKDLARYIFNYVWLNSTRYDIYVDANLTDNINNQISAKASFIVNYNKLIEEKLKSFRDGVLDNYKSNGFSGQNCTLDTSWLIESALLFSISLMTTIGYGHVAPTTWEGMIVCICYSMIGIALCLLSLSKLSGDLGDLVRVIYSGIISFFCGGCVKKNSSIKNLNVGSNNDSEIFDSSYVKNEESSKQKLSNSNSKDDFSNKKEEKEKISVPLAISFLIIAGYIGMGSAIFNALEGWSNVQASYFSFISIATIGLGDLIPGIKQLENGNGSRANTSRNLIIATVYIFFGIAFLAMCFDLMQETFILKIGSLTQKIKKHYKTQTVVIENFSNKPINTVSRPKSQKNDKVEIISIKSGTKSSEC